MDLLFSAGNRLVLERLSEACSQGFAAPKVAVRPAPGRQLRLYPHQERVVRSVLGDFGGRALLADDVGLGKTVEAGVCLAGYRWWGLVRRALILAPAALLPQWDRELRSKFGLQVVLARAPQDWRGDLVLGSLDLAKRPDHAKVILAEPWDLLIVDEAHRLKNRRTANWQLVWRIEATYLLLLTATPVQNDLGELYSLVTLTRPGLFATPKDFRRTFQLDRLSPKNLDLLRERLSTVMLRTDRASAGKAFPPRKVRTVPVSLSPPEEEVYFACLELLRQAREGGRTRQQLLPLVTVLREAASSPEAARRTLQRMARTPGLAPEIARRYREVAASARGIPCRKAESLRGLVAASREKALVFTEFRASQDVVARELAAAGVKVVKYHGGLPPGEQEAAVLAFSGEIQVMVSTDAGAEGHNLQFCRRLINFDLPWNPMRLAQRIGRVHRLGQERPVEIVNLAAAGTIEAYVLAILGAKLELCETVLGELDLVFEHGLERRLTDVVLGARSARELEDGFAGLMRETAERRAGFAAIVRRNDLLAGLTGGGNGDE